tara:strand:+ start:1446 stop:1922 length:477 start_codon:yes stop_codon:yes gene_type:complete
MFVGVEDSDNYSTDKSAWEMLLPFIPKDKVIWSPFYSDGNMKTHFAELGIDIIHNDMDFFAYEPLHYDMIIDNPSFSNMKQVCKRFLELDKPFIIVARSNLLICKWFRRMFKQHLQVIIPDKNLTFTHVSHPVKGYSPPFGCFFYAWKMDLPTNMILL